KKTAGEYRRQQHEIHTHSSSGDAKKGNDACERDETLRHRSDGGRTLLVDTGKHFPKCDDWTESAPGDAFVQTSESGEGSHATRLVLARWCGVLLQERREGAEKNHDTNVGLYDRSADRDSEIREDDRDDDCHGAHTDDEREDLRRLPRRLIAETELDVLELGME